MRCVFTLRSSSRAGPVVSRFGRERRRCAPCPGVGQTTPATRPKVVTPLGGSRHALFEPAALKSGKAPAQRKAVVEGRGADRGAGRGPIEVELRRINEQLREQGRRGNSLG